MKRWGKLLSAGVLLLLLLVISNLLVTWVFGGSQLDATGKRRYTLTAETRRIVSTLRQPVVMQLYVSEEMLSEWGELGAHATQTAVFLSRYRLAAADKVRLEIRRIKAFSDMEKQAISEGMQPFSENDKELYLGLKIVAADGRSALLPKLKPERRALLENDLNRILYGLNESKKVKIGIFSPRIPFAAIEGKSVFSSFAALLHEYYEVLKIPRESSLIPQDIGVVLVIDAGYLSPVFAYALDQYVMRGGKVIFLVDPYSEIRHDMQGYPPKPDIEMSHYLKTWGIDYLADRVVGDMLRGEKLKGGDGRYRVYPLWFLTEGENKTRLRFHTAGSVRAVDGQDLNFVELAATGRQGGDIAAEKIRYASKAQIILNYNQDYKKRVLALLAEGKFRSHYRGGILDNTESADKVQPYLPFAVRDAAVAVVADSDFAANDLWVASADPANPVYGVVPYVGNAAFLLRLIDRLSGREIGLSAAFSTSFDTDNIAETLYLDSAKMRQEKKEKLSAREADSAARLRQLKNSLSDSEDIERRREIERAEVQYRLDKNALQNLERQTVAAADDKMELLIWLCFVVFPSAMLGMFFVVAFYFRRGRLRLPAVLRRK